MRLIKADALRTVFTEKSTENVCGAELCKAIISRIDEIPTVDAVPVIRCKDCRWYKTDYSYKYRFCEFGHDIFRKADDFCSRADRRKEE